MMLRSIDPATVDLLEATAGPIPAEAGEVEAA
jgi:hypothetical protein